MTTETEMTTGNCDVCNREYETASSLDHCAEEGLCWEHCTDYAGHVSPSIYDEGERTPTAITDKLTALRGAIDAESISMGELIELANLAPWIEPGDVQLAEWANIPEQTFTRHAGDARPVTYTDAEMERDRAEERGEPCGEPLSDPDGFSAVCTMPWGVEHSHSDHTARGAVAAGRAKTVTPKEWERAAHEAHGGAAGSFYAEGCSLCPPERGEFPDDPSDGHAEWVDWAANNLVLTDVSDGEA